MNQGLSDVLRDDSSVMDILDGFHQSYATDPDPGNDSGEHEDMRNLRETPLAKEVCTQCGCLMGYDPDKNTLSCCDITIHAHDTETDLEIKPDIIYAHIFSEQSSAFRE